MCSGEHVLPRRSSRSVRYRLVFRAKTAQDARRFFVWPFLAPFPVSNAHFSSQMPPFRTLKVQWGTCPPPPWLKKCALQSPKIGGRHIGDSGPGIPYVRRVARRSPKTGGRHIGDSGPGIPYYISLETNMIRPCAHPCATLRRFLARSCAPGGRGPGEDTNHIRFCVLRSGRLRGTGTTQMGRHKSY